MLECKGDDVAAILGHFRELEDPRSSINRVLLGF